MMHTLYSQKGSEFRIEVLAEPKVQEFINAHAGALDSSFKQVEMSDVMRKRLQRSDYIFSGMKTFHELNEAFPSLLDSNGNRKTFEAFLNDVRKIDWRKRSIPTHSGWLYPLTFDAGKGLKEA